jgi:PKD repeat protein
MATSSLRIGSILTGAALLLTACTVQKQETPALTGPSELSTSINIAVTPDVLSQDGASQSQVTVTARDQNGQLIRNLALRAEIAVNGVLADFGTLSAKNIVTDTTGRATLVYTAPSAGAVSTDNGTLVQILVVPSGSNFDNATARYASIRLVPPSVVTPPNNLNASFTFTPGAPTTDSTVLFDASATAGQNPGTTIVSYEWDFGDGARGTGRQASHKFDDGSYTVTLTVRDTSNRTGTTRQGVIVTIPTSTITVAFDYSPKPARLNQVLHFDASGTTVAAPRRIVSYTWNFGDGTIRTTTDPRIDYTYTVGGGLVYTVTLTVTDDTNQTKSSTIALQPQ